MPRTYVKPYHLRLERERIQREHPDRKRLPKAERDARRDRVDYKKRKAELDEHSRN